MSTKKKKDPVFEISDRKATESRFRKSVLADIREEKNTNKKKKNVAKPSTSSAPKRTITRINTKSKKRPTLEDEKSSSEDELKDDDSDDDEDFVLSDDDSDNDNDKDFMPDQSDDDEEIVISTIRTTKKVIIDSTKLKIKSQQDKINGNPKIKKLFKIASDIDPESFKKHCESIISIETLQSNTKAIRELDSLSRSKPNRTTRNTITTSSTDTLLKDHLTTFEVALKDLPESFNIPKTSTSINNGASSSSSSSSARDLDEEGELSLAQISEIILGMEDRSIERRGQDLIAEISDVPFRSRKQEEEMMREPLPFERQCVNGDKCEGLYIGQSNGIPGFILVEFPSQSDISFYNVNNKWPDTLPSLCVICSRKEMTDIWIDDLSKSSLRKENVSSKLCSEALYHNKVGPGEYSASDVFMTDSNRINATVLPIVMHARAKYQLVTRMHTSGVQLQHYNQKMTDPSSFRVGRTRAQSTSNMNSAV